MNEVELERSVRELLAQIEPVVAGFDLRVVAMTIAHMCRRCPTLEPYVILALRSQAAVDEQAKPEYLGFAAKPTFVGKS
jgi:hypothetical protein